MSTWLRQCGAWPRGWAALGKRSLLGALICLLALRQPVAASRLALEAHVGKRSPVARAIMRRALEHLDSSYATDAETRALLSHRPGRTVGRSPRFTITSFVKEVDAAHDAWLKGQFEAVVRRSEAAIANARAYPSTILSQPSGLAALRRVTILAALAYRRLAEIASDGAASAQTATSRQMLVEDTKRYAARRDAFLAELARSFSFAPVRQNEFGGEAEAMYAEALASLNQTGRGSLIVQLETRRP